MSNDSLINTTKLLHAIREIPNSILTSSEKYLLIIVLSCINTKNDTWQPIENIAHFACMSRSSIIRHFKGLEKKHFLTIKRAAHSTHKKSNHYSLNLKLILSFHVDNLQTVDKSGINLTPQDDVGYQIDTRSGIKLTRDRVSNWNPKRERKIERKRERENHSPLPPDFYLNTKSIKLIRDLRLSEDDANEIIDKFIKHHTSSNVLSDDWNRMLQIWMNREMGYRDKSTEEKIHTQTNSQSLRGNGLFSLGELLANTKLNGKGNHTDGLVRDTQGKARRN